MQLMLKGLQFECVRNVYILHIFAPEIQHIFF